MKSWILARTCPVGQDEHIPVWPNLIMKLLGITFFFPLFRELFFILIQKKIMEYKVRITEKVMTFFVFTPLLILILLLSSLIKYL